MKLEAYDAVIFDLGGVVLDIDYQRTSDAFQALGLSDFDEIYSQAQQSGLFDRFEIGSISPQHFVNELLHFLPKGTTPNKVVHAWNQMLLDFPKENIDFLKKLGAQKRIFLLSNTNELHASAFERLFRNQYGFELKSLFEKAYYSHEIGKRKPDVATFQYLCEKNNLLGGQVLFVDDTEKHIRGAESSGLQTKLILSNTRISTYLEI